jgi:O-antigen ligase
MATRRHGIANISTGEPRVGALVVSVSVLLLTAAAVTKFGAVGLALPLVMVIAVALLMRPVAAVVTALVVILLAESGSFGLFTFTKHLYDSIGNTLSPADLLAGLAIVSVGLDLLRRRERPYVPAELLIPITFLFLGMIVGFVMGREGGKGIAHILLAEDVLAIFALLPIAVCNLDLDRRAMARLLQAGLLLAVVKAVLGIVEIASGRGITIEGSARLTYYEPAPNWLISMAILTIFAMFVFRAKLSRWMWLAFPLLLACLLLSYRRSFWIAIALALLLVLLLGIGRLGRRLLLPAAIMVVGAIWLLGSIHFQSAQNPVAKRFTSLKPGSLQTNAADRYRLDERANVVGEIKQHPISGLGLTVPWTATVRSLPQEHPSGRQYVHFAALWFWLKLGILGLIAYIAMIAGGMRLAFTVWRRSPEPLLRAFGLASLCAIVGLFVMDTTASFTGVDIRFTILFSAQLGVLALLARRPGTVEND